MKFKVFLLSAALCAGASGAAAGPYGPPQDWQRPVPQAQPLVEAYDLVRTGMESLLAFLGQEPRPSAMKVAGFLDDQIAGHFDFEFMARAALGPAYNRMSDTRRADMVQKIEQDFLETMSRHLAGYSNQQLRFYRPQHGRGNRAQVSVGVLDNPGAQPSRLDFRLYYGRDGWKIYDVAANGSSAVNYYRQQFQRVWQAPGGFGR